MENDNENRSHKKALTCPVKEFRYKQQIARRKMVYASQQT